jgi:hypothetical protein
MTRLKIAAVAGIAMAGACVSLMLLYRSQAAIRGSEALLQEQSRQMAALTLENERLSNLVAHAGSPRANDNAAELARLRREAAALRKQTNDLGRSSETGQALPPSGRAASPDSRPPEPGEKVRQMSDAKYIATAFRDYADEHQNRGPTNIDQLAPYMAKLNKSLPGNNQFEVVYPGSLDNLDGVPWGAVAVIREQQPWPNSNGRMMRIYAFADGHSEIVGSDDNFQSWEAQHVIAPPPNDPSGP